MKRNWNTRLAMWIAPAALLAGGADPAAAEEAGGAPGRGVSLSDVLRMALEANTEIKVRAQDVVISREEIDRALARFDPQVEAYVSVRDGKRPSPYSDHRPRENLTTANASMAVTKRTRTGATIDLKGDYNLSRADEGGVLLNPLHSSKVSLTLTQPLLRGAGLFINRSSIVLARNGEYITGKRFEDTVMEILVAAEAAYWELVLRSANLADQEETLEAAKKLEADNQVRFELGEISQVDFLQSQRAAAKRRLKIEEARRAVIVAESKLRAITNFEEQMTGVEPVWRPVDVPVAREAVFYRDNEIMRGLRNRPDFNAARRDLESQDIQVRVAKDALRPTLNLIAGVSAEGISGKNRGVRDAEGNILLSPYEGSAGDLFDHMSSGDGDAWNVGVVLSFPWGKRAEKAEYQQRQAISRQTFERLIRAERSVIREVRTAIKLIESSQGRVESARRNRELAVDLVGKAFERLALDGSGTSELVEMLDELSEAKISENAALMDYVLSLTELERATGTLLSNRGINLAPAFVTASR